MLYIFINLHYNHDFVQLRYVQRFFSDILVPDKNFNKSPPKVESESGNMGFKLSAEWW